LPLAWFDDTRPHLEDIDRAVLAHEQASHDAKAIEFTRLVGLLAGVSQASLRRVGPTSVSRHHADLTALATTLTRSTGGTQAGTAPRKRRTLAALTELLQIAARARSVLLTRTAWELRTSEQESRAARDIDTLNAAVCRIAKAVPGGDRRMWRAVGQAGHAAWALLAAFETALLVDTAPGLDRAALTGAAQEALDQAQRMHRLALDLEARAA
jgi:hypothetical protein